MKMRISERDLEAISAYLDGQLTQREQARLEARLKADRGLREAYEQMHHTRAALRSLPVMRAPRNFTLTPQMVKARKSPPPAYPVLRLASVMATLLFVLVMVGDLVTPRSVALAPGTLPQTEEAATLMQAPAETEMPFLEAAPAEEESEDSRKSVGEDQAEGATEPPVGIMEMAAPSPEPTETILPAPPAAAPDIVPEEGSPVLEPRERETVQSLPPTWNFWRVLEVVFALVALSTGLAAAFLRKGMAG
jgi:hypothetical protein